VMLSQRKILNYGMDEDDTSTVGGTNTGLAMVNAACCLTYWWRRAVDYFRPGTPKRTLYKHLVVFEEVATAARESAARRARAVRRRPANDSRKRAFSSAERGRNRVSAPLPKVRARQTCGGLGGMTSVCSLLSPFKLNSFLD